jgi:hypothetical protein
MSEINEQAVTVTKTGRGSTKALERIWREVHDCTRWWKRRSWSWGQMGVRIGREEGFPGQCPRFQVRKL